MEGTTPRSGDTIHAERIETYRQIFHIIDTQLPDHTAVEIEKCIRLLLDLEIEMSQEECKQLRKLKKGISDL